MSMKLPLLILLLMASTIGNYSLAEDNLPRFVFVGDSNTANNQWENGSYVVKLQDYSNPWNKVEIINSGNDGWGVYSYFERPARINQYILDHSPDFILIALGGNDFLRFYSSNDFEIHYRYILGNLLNISQSCGIAQIYLANIYWGTIDLPQQSTNRYYEFQNVIMNLSIEFELPLIDFFNTSYNHTEYYQSDGIHLNEEGHVKIAQTVNSTIGEDISTKLNSVHSGERNCILPEPNLTPSSSKSNESDSLISPIYWVASFVLLQFLKRKSI